jgi:hypothetical protein
MLDLNELERRLDEALAKETEASLSKWLLNQRKCTLTNFLGLGVFERKIENTFSYSQNVNSICSEEIDNMSKEINSNNNLAIAA